MPRWDINITPSAMSIKDLQTTDPITGQSRVLFSSDYRYFHYDPSGNIKFPVNETMSGLNGNLTWQCDGACVVIPNSYWGHSDPVDFNTYLAYFTILNENNVVTNTRATTQVANVEIPGIVGGPDPIGAAGSDGSYGGEGGIGDSSGADAGDSEGGEGEGDGDGGGDGGDGGEGGGDGGEGG